ncbi:protein lap4-like isoform X2 [Dinothrombium tinctorium]|uniref:Protein lap4-like isoform X2 n=1 Tax=Dinothrombium tinctorium TaxID=1965070 RepID=A0A3S3QWA5_9ACAR|nr:protein lap4-like isoform X2 [Dinothrombium tinctorium]RWS06676.1 protein scribble-like protein [Dinothrombium tinctorium]RWS15004.1 protein scribble-like protein [Dinothrombium tinctorium]RWS15047.1 protein lap4-like isoform X2 [Dinothrombium tinctorium]
MAMFRCIPLFKACNRQIEYIDKRHCSLTNVPEDVFRYSRSLEELLLDSNHIRELPKSLFRLVKLRKLSLSDNEIGRLPPDICSLVNLVEFDISKNDIPEIPENIKFLKSLQVGDFSSNPLANLPSGLTHLRNLTSLGLNDVSLQQLPSDFGSLCNLQMLELRDNIMKTLPPSFASLTKLERLDIGSNELEELPDFIGQLPNLTELWLDCNELITLPKSIGKLKKLTCLDVSVNRLEHLPEEIAGLENLTDLHLSQNFLRHLPDGIGQLSKLTILKVDHNYLSQLNPTIGGCSNLQELILTENNLKELPPTIGNLVHLTNLNIDRNKLTALPPQIGNLTKLGVLSLRENLITQLPVEMGQLRELHVLDVSGNRLSYLPYTITALNLKALWLAENQSQPMLKFQTDYDEQTGMKILTCFLLPQQEIENEFENENFCQNGGDIQSNSSWDQHQRPSAVKFAGDESEDEAGVNPAFEAQFVRHDTPHPKEFKARHQKLFANREKDDKSSVENNDSASNEPENSVQNTNQRNSVASNESEESETSSVIIRSDSEIAANIESRQIYYQNSEQQEEEEEEEQEETVDEDNENVEESHVDGISQKSETENEHVEKHVGFPDEYDEESAERDDRDDENEGDHERVQERQSKLHRRDTPHHLKNKRINISNCQAEKEKVASIIAEVLKKEVTKSAGDNESAKTNSSFATIPYPPTPLGPVEIKQIKLFVVRTSTGLGLSIAGGKGSTPYKGEDEGVFVSRITENGPSHIAGLKVGDKILAVNDISMEGVDHYRAVDILKQAGMQFMVHIEREVPITLPSSDIKVGEAEKADTRDKDVQSVHTNGDIASTGNQVQPKIEKPTVSPTKSEPVTRTHENGPVSPVRNLQPSVIYTTLIRDQNGLGFSVAGGKGGPPYKEGSESIYISRIAEGGAAARDGKLMVGDKILSINSVDVEGLKHDQVVAMLTGLERFVRLVVEREMDLSGGEKSPRPRAYANLYSSSYMANRPSYLGSYKRPILGSLSNLNNDVSTTIASATTTTTVTTTTAASATITAPTTTSSKPVIPPKPTYIHRKLPGLRNDSSVISTSISTAASPSTTTYSTCSLPSSASHKSQVVPTSSASITTLDQTGAKSNNSSSNSSSSLKKSNTKVANPVITVKVQKSDGALQTLPASLAEFPPAPTAPGLFTEVITKTTFTETVTTRVTNNVLVPK